MMLTNLSSNKKLLIWCAQCLIFIFTLLFLLVTEPIKINANLTSLFTKQTDNSWYAAQQKINAGANTKQIYLIGHKELLTASQAAEAFIKQANNISGVDGVVGKLSIIPDQTTMINSYQGFEHQLLSPEFRQSLVDNDKNRTFQLQFELINQIGDQLVANTLQINPTLSFANYLNRSPFPQNKIVLSNDGYLTISHEKLTYVLVTLNTPEGALNVNVAKSIVAQLNKIEKQEGIEYIRTGAIFYSDEASRTAQTEMQWLGGLSMLATLLLIYLSYRRISAVITTLMLISISGLYGIIGLNIFFVEVNILTMVFAVTLVGIAVDYSFHSFTELQYVNPKKRSPLSTIRISLLLSFTTTALGYALLVVVPIDLFKQIAVFTIFGLFGALVTVLLLYPALHHKLDFSRTKSPVLYKQCNLLHKRLLDRLMGKSVIPLVVSCVFAGFIADMLFIDFSDNPKTFYQVSSALKENETQVKKVLGQKFDNQYLLIKGQTPQALLEQEELLLPTLNQLIDDNVVGSYQAISNWLPSIKQQKMNNSLLVNANKNGQFSQLSALLGTQVTVKQVTDDFLTPDIWLTSPLGKMFKHLWLEDEGTVYSVIRFSGINDVTTLSNRLASLEQSVFVDTLADAERDLSRFRQVMLIVFAIAFVAAFFVFTIRYGWKKALVGVLVPVMAFSIAMLVSGLIQTTVNLFNVAAGLVILALGLDYSVFYAEHGFAESITQTTLMSACSSIFVFAMLGFSSTPAVASFGQTVFVGIVITFLCSPIITYISEGKGRND